VTTIVYILDGISFEEARALSDSIRDMPMDAFCDDMFGKGNWTHDSERGLWVTKNPHHQGEGYGYIAVRPDKTWFTGVVPPGQCH
jgi:hypothetical protein